MTRFFLPFLVAVLVVSGCAFLKSMARTGAVAGGAAGGALVGSAAGPIGTVVGAGVGGGAVYAVQENSELRQGSLQGDGAREEETKRLKALLMLAEGDLRLKNVALSAAQERLEGADKFWLKLFAAAFVSRNLLIFPKIVGALLKKRWLAALKWSGHLFHPWRPKE